MIVLTDFESLTDDLQEIYNEASKVKVANMEGNKVFEIRDTNRLTFDHLILHGVGGMSEVTPGADLPTVNSDEGDSISYTQRYFGANFKVTKQMRKFDLYEQIEGLAKSMADNTFDRLDQSYADALLYGQSTSYTDVWGSTVSAVGPNGLALFSTVQSNGVSTSSITNSNIITNSDATVNPALSRDAIVNQRRLSRVYKDPENLVKGTHLDTVLIAPANEDLAERILFSTQMSGTGNNDVNSLKGKIKNLIVWDRLETRSDDTDTSAYWFMSDSSKVGETLKSKFAERPTLDAPEQVYRNKNWEYTTDMFYTIGLGYQLYVAGSTGVN